MDLYVRFKLFHLDSHCLAVIFLFNLLKHWETFSYPFFFIPEENCSSNFFIISINKRVLLLFHIFTSATLFSGFTTSPSIVDFKNPALVHRLQEHTKFLQVKKKFEKYYWQLFNTFTTYWFYVAIKVHCCRSQFSLLDLPLYNNFEIWFSIVCRYWRK